MRERERERPDQSSVLSARQTRQDGQGESDAADWKHEVAGKDGKMAAIKVNWSVRLELDSTMSQSRIEFWNSIFKFWFESKCLTLTWNWTLDLDCDNIIALFQWF